MVPPPLSSSTYRRKTFPDVPEDIDTLLADHHLHWNDPNYDIDSLPSPTRSSNGSIELDDRGIARYKYSASEISGSRADGFSKDELEEYPTESVYAEVRATVSNIDDPLMPCNTFRTWAIGIFFTFVISAFNGAFYLRNPSVRISGIVAQVLALPVGRLLEWVLPTTRYNTFGYTWSLNPGPFNVKEHTLITVMSLIAQVGCASTDVILAQDIFYGQKFGYGYELMMTLSTQLIGYSLCAFLTPFIVWPGNMIWPGNLANVALFNTLHSISSVQDKRHMSREKFFFIVAFCSFLWYWVPGFLWTGLSMFNWVCWIAPDNVTVNTLFGYSTGLGMGILTFDWAMITYAGNPLVTPWWTEANYFVSLVFWHWFITPILYFTNVWYSAYLPISAGIIFDNTASIYNISAIVTNGEFDAQKYRAYSPVYFPTTYILAYCMAFAGSAALVVHICLWNGRDIVRMVQRRTRDETDIHYRLMRSYPEVPHWWYGCIFIVSFVLGVISIEIYNTGLPVWALFLSVGLGLMFSLPSGIMWAVTNQLNDINELSEIIAGVILPGRPLPNMLFKIYSSNTLLQALSFAGNLKLGQYMKVPPRLMFTAQVVATFITSVVLVVEQRLLMDNIPEICTPLQPNSFTCPSTRVFAQASLLFGGVGPNRLFGSGALYNVAMWFFLIGAVSPIPFYLLVKKYPSSILRYVYMPVMWKGPVILASINGANLMCWCIVGFVFQYCLRQYRRGWWARYNYILATGLDFGLAMCSIVLFFAVFLPKGGINLNWWGNTVYQNTADFKGIPLKTLAPGEIFGPKTWS